VPRYQLRYEAAYLNDLRSLQRAYDLPVITRAVLGLADQAETPSRNRRRLAAPISWCMAATWQQRVDDYRVLYRVEDGFVHVLRVRFKSSKTTEEMGP
jgi:mRNA-degrading endonuclease RelE of RelBE toxin-antitoxin system